MRISSSSFSFNQSPPTEISTLSLHDALPIWRQRHGGPRDLRHDAVRPVSGRDLLHRPGGVDGRRAAGGRHEGQRSEEHTSELQSLRHLVCRLLLEKKKKTHIDTNISTLTSTR